MKSKNWVVIGLALVFQLGSSPFAMAQFKCNVQKDAASEKSFIESVAKDFIRMELAGSRYWNASAPCAQGFESDYVQKTFNSANDVIKIPIIRVGNDDKIKIVSIEQDKSDGALYHVTFSLVLSGQGNKKLTDSFTFWRRTGDYALREGCAQIESRPAKGMYIRARCLPAKEK